MQSVKQFGSKYDPTLLGPDLCLNIVQSYQQIPFAVNMVKECITCI